MQATSIEKTSADVGLDSKAPKKREPVTYTVIGLAKDSCIINLKMIRTDASELTPEDGGGLFGVGMIKQITMGVQGMMPFKQEPPCTLIQLTDEEYRMFGRPTIGDTVELQIFKNK